jgi:hypothetical protein
MSQTRDKSQVSRIKKGNTDLYYVLDIIVDDFIEFKVCGESKKCYTVSVFNNIKCNCVDAKMRGDKYRCKHICFILAKVLGMEDTIYENPILQENLDMIMQKSKDMKSGMFIGKKICSICYNKNRKKLSICKQCNCETHVTCQTFRSTFSYTKCQYCGNLPS